MTTSTPIVNWGDILTIQDATLLNSLNSMSPEKLQEFINTRKTDVYNAVTSDHSDTFQKVHGDLVRSGNTVKNILYYAVRNKDLESTHDSVYNSAKGNADAAIYDSQIAKRQFEINEWTAGSKRDTLFFMQVMFIALMIYVPLLYLNRIGIIPNSTLYMIGFLLLLAVIFTFVVRYQYSDKLRDNKYWSRRRFAQMGGPPVTPTCEALKSLAEQSATSLRSGFSSVGSVLSQE